MNKKRLNLLFAVDSLESIDGGICRCVPALANELIKLGHRLHIHTNKNIIDPTFETIIGKEIGVTFSSGKSSLLKERILTCDLIHSHGIWIPFFHNIRLLASKYQKILIISPHGSLEKEIRHRNKIKKILAWILYQKNDLKYVDYFHATSDKERQSLLAIGIKHPIFYVPNGIELFDESYLYNSKDNILDVNKFNILIVSRVHPMKGFDLLVEVVSKLKAEFRIKNVIINVLGTGDSAYIHKLLSIINKFGISDLFKFYGHIDGKNKFKIYSESDLFILPSFSECFGLSIGEAMSFGIPVITTTSTPWGDLVSSNSGWWVDPNVSSIMGALKSAISISSIELKKMGIRGSEYIKERYSWSKIGQTMEIEYKKILFAESSNFKSPIMISKNAPSIRTTFFRSSI